MALDIKGKGALVTGAGRGICLAFAKKLLEGGCSVLIADLALSSEADAVVNEYTNSSTQALFLKTDVTDWTQLQLAFDKAIEAFPSLDIVCPGAGIFEPPLSAFWHLDKGLDTPATSTYRTLEINLTHPIGCTQLAIDCFLRQGHGRGVVVHTSSVGAQMAAPVAPLYTTSKAAISHFVRSLAMLEPAINVRVNAVAPANVETSLWEDAGRREYIDDEKDEWVPLERIAEMMVALVTDPDLVGGTVLEAGVDTMRKVTLLNDPGSDPTARGFMSSRAGEVAQKELQELMGKNFGQRR